MFARTRSTRVCLLVIIGAAFGARTGLAQGPIIIDHTCTDLEKVPVLWIEQAKATLRVTYGHTSHGSQPISGMNVFKNPAGSLYWWDRDGTQGGLSLWDRTPEGDLGNPDRTTWATRTRALLDDPNNDRNCVIWSWCGQADTTPENMQIYLDLMSDLERDYPDVWFVYMTGHLNGTGETGNLHLRNSQIRDHVIANNAILFDFADIESYDPDYVYYLPLGANDACEYWVNGVMHNWAEEWCASHPGECSSCSCAHSRSLNCDLKGRAFWWMLARIAGWSGLQHGDLNCDGAVNGADIDPFFLALGDPAAYAAQFPNCDIMLGDMNGDGAMNGADIDLFFECLGGGGCP